MGIITISGNAGAGKSTIGKMLCKKLKLPYFDLGTIRREMAKKHGMSLSQYNKLGETEAYTDHEVDKAQQTLGRREHDFVMVSRLGFHFIPHSIKIFLTIDKKIAAKRVYADKVRRVEEHLKSERDAYNKLVEREASDLFRYKKYYKLNPYDKKQYDLTIDTSNLSPKEIVDMITKKILK